MLISELSFPHLQAAADARLSLELERRRVVQERLGDLGDHGARRLRRRAARAASSERMPRARAAAPDAPAAPDRRRARRARRRAGPCCRAGALPGLTRPRACGAGGASAGGGQPDPQFDSP